jgi:hypothetical protein
VVDQDSFAILPDTDLIENICEKREGRGAPALTTGSRW